MPTYNSDDGTVLHYDVLGPESAPPLVVLAGGAAAHPGYLGDLAGLSEQWRLVVPHLRGVGLSPMPTDVQQASYWRQAADIDRLRAHLGAERALLVGHSAGTRLATAYAAQHPDRVAGLVLITPPAAHLVDVPSDAAALAEARRSEPAFAAALAAQDAGPDISTDETFTAWWHACAALGYATWGTTEQEHSRGCHWYVAGARAYFSVDPPVDFVERLRTVTAPVLVVAGERDTTTGLAPVVALADLFPAGTAVTVSASGHHPWVEQPDAFRRAVDPFLETVARRAYRG